MNLYQLETFLAVIRCGSFTKAAEEVHLTQSAVSRQIQDLEKSFGVALFERLGRSISLTPAGEILSREAKKLLREAANLRERLHDHGGGSERRLRIGGTVSATNTFLPPVLAGMRCRTPDLELSLRPGYNSMLVAMLRDNELDVAVLGGTTEANDLVTESVVDDELVIVGAADHPLAEQGPVEAPQLHRQEMIARPRGAHSQTLAETWFGAHEIAPKPILELP